MTAPSSSLPGGAVRALACPSCGAAVALRALDWTQTVACASCAAVLDARDPNLRVLHEAQQRVTVRPLLPLGTRGDWQGAPYEVIGMQQRTIDVDGARYSWREYVLFNPYRGFRYLTEYDGHWNDVVPLPAVPEPATALGRPALRWEGETFRHFQTARARTTFVLGEFPWEARVGDEVVARDHVAPPRVLSAEDADGETTWSLGTYVDGAAVWRAFGLDGRPPAPRGVYADQPSPFQGRVRSMWATFALLAAVVALAMLARVATARDAVAFRGDYVFRPTGEEAGRAFVTPSFVLAGRSGNVVLETRADLDDQWMAVGYTLVDETTGETRDLPRELAYYSGRDEDGPWHEGSRRDRVRLGPVAGGRYFLRIEPAGGDPGRPPVAWSVAVRRDVASPGWYLLALVVLAIPPIVVSARQAGFETRRWAESDHAPAASSDDA